VSAERMVGYGCVPQARAQPLPAGSIFFEDRGLAIHELRQHGMNPYWRFVRANPV